jgi:hypothetical protein
MLVVLMERVLLIFKNRLIFNLDNDAISFTSHPFYPKGKTHAVPNDFMGLRAVIDAVEKRKISPLPLTEHRFLASKTKRLTGLASYQV